MAGLLLVLGLYLSFPAALTKGEQPNILRERRGASFAVGTSPEPNLRIVDGTEKPKTPKLNLHPQSEAHLRHLQWLFRSFTDDDTSANLIHNSLLQVGKVKDSSEDSLQAYRAEAVASKAFIDALKASEAKKVYVEQTLNPDQLPGDLPGSAGNSNLLPELPPETLLLSPEEVEDQPPMDELQMKIDYWEAQNVTDQWLQFVKELSPPLNTTPGINEVTAKLQTVLSPEARDAIIYATPDISNNDLWSAVALAWENYLKGSRAIQENSVAREFVEPVVAAANIYNEYAEWRYEAPWDVYDAKVQARQQVLEPFRDEREQWIAKRDELLAAKNELSTAFWRPHVNMATATRIQLQEAVDAKNEVANDLILHEYGTALEAIRAKRDVNYLLKTVGKSLTIICYLNPQCCDGGDVYRCPPSSLNSPF